MQTEPFQSFNGIWARALARLFRLLPESAAGSAKHLSTALIPYVEPSATFLNIMTALSTAGWTHAELMGAMRDIGFDLAQLIDQFFLVEERRIVKGVYNRPWLRVLETLRDADRPDRKSQIPLGET